jgi:hypothetical protein
MIEFILMDLSVEEIFHGLSVLIKEPATIWYGLLKSYGKNFFNEFLMDHYSTMIRREHATKIKLQVEELK